MTERRGEPPAGLAAVETVERLLRRARDLGASDLHLDAEEDGVAVTLRVDGVLQALELLPAEIGPRLVGRLKALADLLAYRSDVPQEGRIPGDRTGLGVEVRVATYPALLGERVAVRLDTPDAGARRLEDLGLPEHVLGGLRRALEEPDGVVLVTGPSGSGKTTTLYAALHQLAAARPRRSVVTVEDPVERRIPGATQTQVRPGAGLTFARGLRSLLRQDPDVLLVGEIRDRETAAIALEAGLTGHLVVSTIHAGTAPQVFARLLEMDVEPFVLTTTVRGVLAQRLVRRARGDGFHGRCLVAEWLPVGASLRAAILARSDGDALLAAARSDGFRTLREEAAALVEAGETTAREVDRVLGR